MRGSAYLFFREGCAAALAAYEARGLGRVTDCVPQPDGRILHARFEGPGLLFHASDNEDAEPMRGFALFLQLPEEGALRRLFAALAEGGRVTTPLGPQPWSALHGKLTDRFGVQWMLMQPAADPA